MLFSFAAIATAGCGDGQDGISEQKATLLVDAYIDQAKVRGQQPGRQPPETESTCVRATDSDREFDCATVVTSQEYTGNRLGPVTRYLRLQATVNEAGNAVVITHCASDTTYGLSDCEGYLGVPPGE